MAQCKSIYMSDGESSVVTVKRAINAYLQNKAVMEESPVGEHASNGAVETAIKVVRNQFKALRSALEARLKERIEPRHPILQWLLRWTGQMLNRYRVDKHGRTAYELIRGKKCKVSIAEFGERVAYLERTQEGELKNKGETDWRDGVWLGLADRSGDPISRRAGGQKRQERERKC